VFQQQLPLVGRDADLRLLELVLDRAAVGSGSVALISGEAGIGKTRLCQELGRSQRDRGSQVLLGRAFPEETAISFGAIADTLRAARRGEPPMWQAASARASVLWAIAPELATTSDVERRSFDHPVLFEALLDAVDEAAGDRVTLWVLEDLHWADEATWEFVRYAARRVAGMGLVLGVTYREEELGAAHPWWGNLVRLQRDPSVVHVPLQRLSAADGERLVRALGAVAAPGVGGHDPPAQRRHAAAGAGAGEPGGALGGGAGPARRRAGHRRGTGGAAGPGRTGAAGGGGGGRPGGGPGAAGVLAARGVTSLPYSGPTTVEASR
jgi:predicted ATPase